MTSLTREDLLSLRDAQAPCVSLYMPTLRLAIEVPQNRTRLKNLLRRAEEQLVARGDGGVDELLAPGREMMADTSFWQHPSDGLALFLSPGTVQSFRVTTSFPELAMVGDRFHLAPLLPLLSGNGHFHLLALSQKQVRLFAGDRDGLQEVELHGVPRSVQEALHYEVSEHSLQFHSTPATPQTIGSRGRPGGAGQAVPTGRRQGMFHGHGVVDDDAKEQVQRFCEVLAEGLERSGTASSRRCRWCSPASTTSAPCSAPPAGIRASSSRASRATPSTCRRRSCASRCSPSSSP